MNAYQISVLEGRRKNDREKTAFAAGKLEICDIFLKEIRVELVIIDPPSIATLASKIFLMVEGYGWRH